MLTLLLVNVGIYYVNFNRGIIFTGLILLAASFSLLAITFEIVETSFYIKIGSRKIAMPSIDYLSLGLFAMFCLINFSVIRDFYRKIRGLR
jgi:hypothetical protein